jgi:hypothetical protein
MSVKEGPVRGLRGVIARWRRKGAATPVKTRTAAAADANGHVTVLPAKPAPPQPPVAAQTAPKAETPAPETAPPETAAPEAAAAEPGAEAPVADGAAPESGTGTALPLENYDTLTIASLRARLRTLTPDGLAVLIDYEKAHQAREDVIGMFERRSAKIAAGLTTGFTAVN